MLFEYAKQAGFHLLSQDGNSPVHPRNNKKQGTKNKAATHKNHPLIYLCVSVKTNQCVSVEKNIIHRYTQMLFTDGHK